MAPLKDSKLFQHIRVGNVELQHRVVMAPLTRFRADEKHVHQDVAVEYYAQRASVPGTLLMTEGTFITEDAGGYDNVPGIWNQTQIAAWKKVTNAVHAKGSFIFCQLWALGRAATPKNLAKEGGYQLVSSSAVPIAVGKPVPHALTPGEIEDYKEKYAQAARNAMEAGFDGVELHGANGYLIDQFIQSTCNQRNDEYGGSVENRARFVLELADSVSAAIGEERTALRMSPWGRVQGMGMPDPIPTFSYIVSQLRDRHPRLAYISLVEPVIGGDNDQTLLDGDSNAPLHAIWQPRPLILSGGWTNNVAGAVKVANEKQGVLCGFGRAFIPNPDLPLRLKNGIPFTKYDRKTFYTRGPAATRGYIDYPAAASSKL
ncbi:FMN-linked oxidoreductase [Clavulina sp. PMI_390]|nr:FMN-linked oxidoreductase [Clavulina sp. PMI_390]